MYPWLPYQPVYSAEPCIEPTVAEFRARFPEFNDIPDTQVQQAIDDASCWVDTSWLATACHDCTTAMAFLAAHYLALGLVAAEMLPTTLPPSEEGGPVIIGGGQVTSLRFEIHGRQLQPAAGGRRRRRRRLRFGRRRPLRPRLDPVGAKVSGAAQGEQARCPGGLVSIFGHRIAAANAQIDREYADLLDYYPMREVVNASPEPDDDRPAGKVRAILLQPGSMLGSGWSLNAMHDRAASEPKLYFMARDLLTDVRRFDRFALASARHNPDYAGTKVYEVGDGPFPIGFGRFRATLVEIAGPDVPLPPLDALPPWGNAESTLSLAVQETGQDTAAITLSSTLLRILAAGASS